MGDSHEEVSAQQQRAILLTKRVPRSRTHLVEEGHCVGSWPVIERDDDVGLQHSHAPSDTDREVRPGCNEAGFVSHGHQVIGKCSR